MPNIEYTLTMARYNLWQNQNLLSAASALSSSEREKDRGAFFGSIKQTFSHLFWGDQIWMSRFTDSPPPENSITDSTDLVQDWQEFCTARNAFDVKVLQWAHKVTPDWFDGDLSWYSGAINRDITKPKKTLIIQFFNHQTHHRGQIHAMLTSAGQRPGDTDVPFMPEDFCNM